MSCSLPADTISYLPSCSWWGPFFCGRVSCHIYSSATQRPELRDACLCLSLFRQPPFEILQFCPFLVPTPATCATSSCSLLRAPSALGATGALASFGSRWSPGTTSCSSSGLSLLDMCAELFPHPTSPAGHRVTPHCMPPCRSWGHVFSRIFILLMKS